MISTPDSSLFMSSEKWQIDMIDIDFNKAYVQAETMAQCADGIQQQQQKLNNLIAEIRRAWHGETATAYINKLEAFSDKLKTEAKMCRESAVTFRTRINSIKTAEEAVQRTISIITGTNT